MTPKASAKTGQSDSVYGFLYYDARRIGSFLAQFDDSGHLQQVRQSDTARKGNKRGFKITAGAGATGSESSERIYDPLWSNACTLLDYLEAANLIGRDLGTARIGQFVIASGDLTVLNTSMLPKFFESTRYQELTIRQAIDGFRKQWNAVPQNAALTESDKAMAGAAAVKVTEENARVNMDLLSHFPYSAQCTIIGGGLSVWSTLTVEGMVGSVADLSLKHGTNIPGTWHLLGILDALPSPIPPQILTAYTGIPEHFDKPLLISQILAARFLGENQKLTE